VAAEGIFLHNTRILGDDLAVAVLRKAKAVDPGVPSNEHFVGFAHGRSDTEADKL